MSPTIARCSTACRSKSSLDAASTLNVDAACRERVRQARSKLVPYQIGSRGQLQEWAKDFSEQDPEHRHFSHLFGMHPGHEITRDATPAIFDAARRAMELRGDLATGWSMAWKKISELDCTTATMPFCFSAIS